MSEDEASQKLPFRILNVSENDDLALIALPAGRLYRSIGFQELDIQSGETVFSLGFPQGLRNLASGKIVFPSTDPNVFAAFTEFSHRLQPLNYRSCIVRDDIIGGNVQSGNVVTTNNTDHGSSGGALLSAAGRLVGLVVAFKRDVQAVESDLKAITGIDLKKFDFPERLTISRSVKQLRKFMS